MRRLTCREGDTSQNTDFVSSLDLFKMTRNAPEVLFIIHV